MDFRLKEKKTFFSSGYVKINTLDNRFNPNFYEFEKSGGFLFNLPAASYTYVNGSFSDTDSILDYSIVLPEAERDNEVKGVKIKIKKTPYKAQIYRHKNLVIIDPFVFKYPQYVFEFIYQHELGHYLYETEVFCDLYSANRMLEKGYNPTQIKDAMSVFYDKMKSSEVDERFTYVAEAISESEINKFIK